MNNLQKATEIVKEAQQIDRAIAAYKMWNMEYKNICETMNKIDSEHILIQKYMGKTKSFAIENVLFKPIFEAQMKENIKKIKALQVKKSKLNHKL